MAIYLKWHMCPYHEPLVAQVAHSADMDVIWNEVMLWRYIRSGICVPIMSHLWHKWLIARTGM